jgi:hypothetical protein
VIFAQWLLRNQIHQPDAAFIRTSFTSETTFFESGFLVRTLLQRTRKRWLSSGWPEEND